MSTLGFAEVLAELERALTLGTHPSLDGIRALCEELGRPQDAFASVQVTGTNGKTSTVRLTEAILRAHGVATALYTSPHLERYPERIEVAGEIVSDEGFATAVSSAIDAAEKIRPGALGKPEGFTEFELLTAAALWLFRERGVEIAVLEVGMGGTWDSTSVVDPSVAVITGVALDHTAVLGGTVEEIAADKAGIIKPASAPVLGPGTAGIERVFLERADAAATHARAVRAVGETTPTPEELTVRYEVLARPTKPGGVTRLDLRGVHGRYDTLEVRFPSYQAANVATAVAAAEAALGRALDAQATREALRAVTLPGRFELVRSDPPLVVDGSHNPQAAAVLASAIAEAWPDASAHPDLLLGVLADKDAQGIVAALAPVARVVGVCAPDSPRALPVERLAAIVESVTGERPAEFPSVAAALDSLAGRTYAGRSRAGLVVTGSLTTAGEARALLRRSEGTRFRGIR